MHFQMFLSVHSDVFIIYHFIAAATSQDSSTSKTQDKTELMDGFHQKYDI